MDIVTALLILGVQGILESDVKLRSELIKQKQRRAPVFDMFLQSVGRRKVVEEKRERKTRGMLCKGWRTCRRFVKQPSQQILATTQPADPRNNLPTSTLHYDLVSPSRMSGGYSSSSSSDYSYSRGNTQGIGSYVDLAGNSYEVPMLEVEHSR